MNKKLFGLIFVCLLVLGYVFFVKTGVENLGLFVKEHPALAYWAVFEEIYEVDSALNTGSKYLAIDLTKVKLDEKKYLIQLFEEFCEANGYILLQDTIEELEEKGYIKDLYFEEGFVIIFDDKELREGKLITAVTKWRSGLGAIGADYTVELKRGIWKITKTENNWIS